MYKFHLLKNILCHINLGDQFIFILFFLNKFKVKASCRSNLRPPVPTTCSAYHSPFEIVRGVIANHLKIIFLTAPANAPRSGLIPDLYFIPPNAKKKFLTKGYISSPFQP